MSQQNQHDNRNQRSNVDEPFDPENAESFVVDFLGDEHVEPVEPVVFRIRDPIELSLSKP